jgi:hypothetical protein
MHVFERHLKVTENAYPLDYCHLILVIVLVGITRYFLDGLDWQNPVRIGLTIQEKPESHISREASLAQTGVINVQSNAVLV